MASVKAEPDDGVNWGPAHATNLAPEDTKTNVSFLQKLISSNDPELLEKGVVVGTNVLKRLKDRLAIAAGIPSTQATDWLDSIGSLEALAKPTRTIVGVVGNTGAGKSSVISAVLDEER